MGTATVHVNIGDPTQVWFVVRLQQTSGGGALSILCGTGQLQQVGCGYTVHQGDNTLIFYINGYNSTNSPVFPVMTATWDVQLSQSFTVNPVQSPQQSPNIDPDTGPCRHCEGNGAPAGTSPVNFANGNTWITQQDYSVPGLAGGLTLARTWNSLWSLASPPEQVGIFGHSWRSNFEERIQTLSGGVVKYWKGDGNSLFYLYDSLSSTYRLTAPIDDQTSLSANSGTWIISEKNGTQRTFNSAGYLTSIVDRNGNTITINVDASNQNRIASVTDASGRILTFNYANPSYPRLCTSISDSVGTFTTYNYDFTTSRLTRVTYPDGSQYNFSYTDPNSNTLISLVTDSLGKTIEAHTYDSQRRGVTAQQANDSSGRPVNKVTVSYYYPWTNKVSLTDSKGNQSYLTIRNVAQSHYLIASQNSCASCMFLMNSQAGVSANGYKTVFIDGNGKSTYFSYDTQGNLSSKSLPRGNPSTGVLGVDTWNYTYNQFGEVLSATDPLGQPGDPNHTTVNTYDTHGNLLTVTTPSPDGVTPGSVTSFTYNPNGTLVTITDPLGNTTTITYCPSGASNCPLGLIQNVTDANNKVTSYTYDSRGNRLTNADPVNGPGSPTTFTYDAMNRVTSITYPGATVAVQFHYDYRGRRDSVTDQNGNVTRYAYDDADRLIPVTDSQTPTAGVTRYVYDTENNLTDIYDASNRRTQFSYNAYRQLQQTTFPSGLSETYFFDLNNNLTAKTDRLNNRTAYTYDYQNRLVKKQYPSGTPVNYTYDSAGRLTRFIRELSTRE